MASKIRKTQPWISAAEQREKETTAGKK